MSEKMLIRALPFLCLFISYQANAVLISNTGHSNVSLAGGVYTFIFDDNIAQDIVSPGASNYMDFSGLGLTLRAMGSGQVIQDDWYNGGAGGLGVNGGPGGDNLAIGESMSFSLLGGLSFDLIGLTLNGGENEGHSDCLVNHNHATPDEPAQVINWSSSNGSSATWHASLLDGCAASSTNDADITEWDNGFGSDWLNMTSISVTSVAAGPTSGGATHPAFNGYVESLTLRVRSAVPEPSILALMGFGLAGLGFARRRKLQK